MTRLKIALMAGGDSPERGIALQSAAQIEAALDHTKYDITVIDLHHRDWHYTAPDGREWQVDKNDFSLTVEDERKAFDYALIIIHGTPGEDGKLQGYLDMMGVPYSSCSMTSSVITFDKITTKRTVAGQGINLAREIFLRKGETAQQQHCRNQQGQGTLHKLHHGKSTPFAGYFRVSTHPTNEKREMFPFTEYLRFNPPRCSSFCRFSCADIPGCG